MRREEQDFTKAFRAMNGGTEVNAMLEYRKMKKTNTLYTRGLVNDTIEDLNGRGRNLEDDDTP